MQVFVFLLAALFTAEQAPWVLFSLYVMSIVMSIVTSLIFKRQYVNNDAFILEMPPYRFPTVRQMTLTGWQEVRHFLNRATRFIVIGVVMIWVLTNFPQGVEPGSIDSWAGQLGNWLQPIFQPIGINAELTIALLFGFIAKEIVIGSLAVIYGQEGAALVQTITQQITWVQAYSFMLFVLIYTPCVSTIATIRKETKSVGFTVLSVAWPLLAAWLVTWTFYKTATALIG
jgi:ferrous iron transport protein B